MIYDMKIDDFILIFKIIIILEILKITSLPCSLFCVCFSLICIDCVFTRNQMILQVIEVISE